QRHRRRASAARPVDPRRLVRPSQSRLPRAAAHRSRRAGDRGDQPAPGPGGHRLLHPPQRGGRAHRRAAPTRTARAALPRGVDRHRALVTYFGQPYERDPCGACDVCLGEIVAGDAGTGGATRLLEAVDTLRGRFGATHVVDVLVGAATARMAQLGHDRLDVYGVLRGEKKGQVRAWIDQLLAHGLLARTDDEYPTVTLTAEGRA